MSSKYNTKSVTANLSGRGDLDYIDTSLYRFEAVVDWIAFRIETVAPTQFRYIQEHLAELIGSKPHVDPIDSDTGTRKFDQGGTTTVFDIRVYDDIANSSQKLVDLFAHLVSKFPLVGGPQVTGIEIALDAYSRGRHEDELRKMARWMMQHLNAPSENVRRWDKTYKTFVTFDRLPAKEELDPELNLRIGNKCAPLSYQVYLKRTDLGGEAKLDLEQQRARSEFTLIGDGLAKEGIRTLDDLAAFDLGRLAKRLRFANQVTLKQAIAGSFCPGAIKSAWDDRAVCLNSMGWSRRDTGKDGYRKHAALKLRKYSRYATPNAAFNRIVTDCFTELGGRYLPKKYNENDKTTTLAPLEPA